MPHRTSLSALVTAITLTLTGTQISLAESVHADFNDVRTGQLRDQSGGEGFEAGSSWTGDTAMVRVVPGDLRAPAAINHNLEQGGKSHMLKMTHSEGRVVHRPLASSLRNEVWGTFLIQVPAGGAAGLGFNTGLTHSTFSAQAIIAEADSDKVDLVYRIGGKDKKRAAGAIQAGKPTLILYRIVYSPRSPDKGFAAWINPDLLAPLPKPDLFSATIGNGSIDRITVGGMGGGQLDAIRISSDSDAFTDVTGQPFVAGLEEPTGVAPLSGAKAISPVAAPIGASPVSSSLTQQVVLFHRTLIFEGGLLSCRF